MAPMTGLDSADAARRLAADGPNALPDSGRGTWMRIVADAAREPMFVLLLAASVLYLLLGEARDSLFLLAMVVLVIGLTLFQEVRTERALRALRALAAPVATVLRDGMPVRIPAAQIVRGDLLVLEEGDRIPADARLVATSGLTVDESLLTGESVPVAKRAGSPGTSGAPAAPGGEGQPWVFAGTLVVQGDGIAQVHAVGAHSELGRIGATLGAIRQPPGRLQRETGALARRLALLGIAVSLLLVLLLGLRNGDWLAALLAGVALSMSVLPEEFPVILAVFPALGAWRLARRGVLTRRLAAIDILGSISVLCVDKTGTLTENRLALQVLWRDGARRQVDAAGGLAPDWSALLATARHASRPRAADPVDRAVCLAAQAHCSEADAAQPLHEYGLRAGRPFLARIWPAADGAFAAAKGAPEAVAALCAGAEAGPMTAAAAALAREGYRVLAVAQARQLTPPWPDDPARLPFRPVGLIALADPLRPDIPAAVAACRTAGIRVLMITGDHPETASAIARQAGLAGGATLTGADIARLDAAALARALDGAGVCARVVPAQKLAIVRALQRNGDVVAMTGDGVNDAPALRAADVGVAMGARGTDVAREAADLTLLDDRFAALVDAVRMGRRIYGNMRKSMSYVATIHVPIAVLALLPPLLGWPVLLYPLHIVCLELLIDPACSLAFEAEPVEPGLMRRPPRPRAEALFGRRALGAALLRGCWAACLLAACYGWALSALDADRARATAFVALVLANVALLLAHRQRGGLLDALKAPNPLFLAIAAAALALVAAALWVPALAAALRLAAPPPAWLGVAVLTALAALAGARLLARDRRGNAVRQGSA